MQPRVGCSKTSSAGSLAYLQGNGRSRRVQTRCARMTTALERYRRAPVRRIRVGTLDLAFRTFGSGPPVVWVHGFPQAGVTYRGLLDELRTGYTHHVLDLPGAGDTPWDPTIRDFVTESAAALVGFVEGLGLASFALVGHDSGGSIARIAAARLRSRARALVLFNTELPRHVPLLVRTLRFAAKLPGARWLFPRLLASRLYRRSPLGFGGFFADPALLDGDYHETCVAPLLRDGNATVGPLRAFDLTFVDRLEEIHRRIEAPTLCIWGGQDPFFPLPRARAMVRQWPNARLEVVERAKLLVYEEAPAQVAAWMRPFLAEHLHEAAPRATNG